MSRTPPKKALRRTAPANLGALNILVVDDNHHMRILIAQILRALGVGEVYEAGDGTEALQVMRRRIIDIVMTDYAMEPLDGVSFVELLRLSPDSPNKMIPVIMVTAYSTARRVAEARDAGVNEILVKPITTRAILDRLTRVIDRPRPFVRTADYFGPDRRRRVADASYEGPFRRATDPAQAADDEAG
jgi:two-component system, chemotaxis family, chemotaxis protein CheY